MKKLFIILGTLVFLLIAAMVAIPLFFRGTLIDMVKEEANANINATLDFADVDVSLFRQFPKLALALDEMTLVNHAPFAGDTLADIHKFEVALNLSSLWGDDGIEIYSILIDQPRLNLKALEDGRANWDIMKADTTTQAASEDTSAAPMNLALQHYEIRDGNILVDDRSTGEFIQFEGFNHKGSGDFSQTLFTIATETNIASATVRSGDAAYLSNARFAARINVDVDLDQQKYTLKENVIALNALTLNLDGWIAQAGENIQVDMRLNAPEADFKDILSMIPFIYKKDFNELKAEGKLSLSGNLKGEMTETTVPAFNFNATIANGMFQYPDLPTPVKQVQMDLQIGNPGKTQDHTVVNLKKLHLEILNEPIDARALVKTPVSDPDIDASVKGKLNLDEVKNIFPLEEGMALNGSVDSDFQLKGKLSAIQENQVKGFSAGGRLSFANVQYASPDLPEKINVKRADLSFAPQRASLSNFNAVIGKSDLQANGVLENILGYVFHDEPVKGALALQSNFFDLNPWMAGESEPLAPVELPKNVEFLLDADFKKLAFDNLTLNNMKGQMQLKDQKLDLMGLNANLFQGDFSTNGSYSYLPPKKPKIFFDMKLNDMNIPDLFKNFVTVQQFAPMTQYMQGMLGGSLQLNTDLDNALMPEWQNFFSNGKLKIPKVNIKDFAPFNKISELIKISQLHNPAVNNLNPSYIIKNGRFHLSPITFAIDKYKITAVGSNGFDKSLDYDLKIEVPAAEVKKQGNAFISKALKKDVNLLTNETIIMDVGVGGFFKDPKITVSSTEILKGATDPLKQAAAAEAAKKKAEADKKAQELLNKQKAELEKEKKKAEDKLKDKLKGLWKKKKKN